MSTKTKEIDYNDPCNLTTHEDCMIPYMIPIDFLDDTFEENNFTTVFDLDDIPAERQSISQIKSDCYSRSSLISEKSNLK